MKKCYNLIKQAVFIKRCRRVLMKNEHNNSPTGFNLSGSCFDKGAGVEQAGIGDRKANAI